MERLNDKQYQAALKRIRLENKYIERNRKLKEEKNKYGFKFKLPSTSKLMAAYLFVILNVVLIYAMVAMWKFMDLTYLGVLITDVAAQVLTYFLYIKKSQAENTKGGITYEMAMFDKKNNCNVINSDDEAVG